MRTFVYVTAGISQDVGYVGPKNGLILTILTLSMGFALVYPNLKGVSRFCTLYQPLGAGACAELNLGISRAKQFLQALQAKQMSHRQPLG